MKIAQRRFTAGGAAFFGTRVSFITNQHRFSVTRLQNVGYRTSSIDLPPVTTPMFELELRWMVLPQKLGQGFCEILA